KRMGRSCDALGGTRSPSARFGPRAFVARLSLRGSLAAVLLLVLTAVADASPPVAPLPGYAAAPLLSVRVDGPPGLRVTFYPGSSAGREFPVPAVVGLRPGYIYRLKVTGLVNYPAAAVYPTLEVRGTLRMPPQFNAGQFPAPVVLREEDLARA